jgi:putative ABC transport system permease protein
MTLALRELRRRPGRFLAATGMLTVIVVLLLLLAGLLDGLFLGSTGALRAQPGDAVVYSASARDSLLRSRIDPELRRRVESAPGVRRTGGLGVALVGARVPGRAGTTPTAVFGYELAPRGVPAPPPPGSAWADRRLAAGGVKVGQTLALGPTGLPVRVAGWVDDTSYLLQGALWVDPATWREVRGASRPDATVAGGVFQVLVAGGDGRPAGDLARAVDAATGGATRTLTRDQAVLSLPGTRQQQSTFTAILVVTFAVAGLVVALFFALLVLERTVLYGVLKALGAPAWRLATALTAQAVLVAAVAFAAGAALALAITAVIPAEVPVQLVPSRAAGVAAGVVTMAAVGGALPLRRITRIDPAVAIGGA